MSISSWSDIFFRHFSKYFMCLVRRERPKEKSFLTFLLSSITWIMILSLKTIFSRGIWEGSWSGSLLAWPSWVSVKFYWAFGPWVVVLRGICAYGYLEGVF